MKKTIAFQGVLGANSHLACLENYADYQHISFSSFLDVFLSVKNQQADFGIIPLENSSAGRVSEIHNLLQKHNLSIVAEHFIKIEHCLVANQSADLSQIKYVYSHPQALMQCRNNIEKLKIETIEYSNTATAAKHIAEKNDSSLAAICSKKAAEIYGLKILQNDFQDFDDNHTIFIVISREMTDTNPSIRPTIISLIFTIKNYPGSLYKSLGSFATNNVSMMQIESFIKGGVKSTGGVSDQAAFFVTIEGHPSETRIISALQELEFFAKEVKILGVYYADKIRFGR
jgi:prephenate dehydratase